MRAAIIHELGSTPQAGEVDDPSPVDGKTLLRVQAAALNPIDLSLASGRYGQLPTPHVIGREGVGVAPDGSRVYFQPDPPPSGAIAEHAVVADAALYPLPDTLSDDVALTLGAAGLAAWLSLVDQADLQAGEKVLVIGASGVAGQLAVQLARHLGAARVVGAARNVDNSSAWGTDAVVRLDESAAEQIKEAGDGGFDVVVDAVGGAVLADAIPATAPGARIVTFGVGAGEEATIRLRALHGRRLIGHSALFFDHDHKRAAYARLTELALAGTFDIAVEHYPLEQIGTAWEAQAASPGKKLVIAFG